MRVSTAAAMTAAPSALLRFPVRRVGPPSPRTSAVLFAVVLRRQMALGFRDYLRFPEETAALHLPLWTAFPPILLSLLLLLIAALITSYDGWRAFRAAAPT